MRRALILGGVALLLVAATAGLIRLTMIGAAEFRVAGDRLRVSGLLTLASTERLDRLIEQTPGIETVVLGEISIEGDGLTPVLQKGYVIRAAGLATALADGVTAEAAATFLFLAGTDRSLGAGAGFSVSDWMTPAGAAAGLAPGAAEHVERLSYVADMLGEDAFYWFMIEAAPVGAAHRMTEAEIARFGLVTG